MNAHANHVKLKGEGVGVAVEAHLRRRRGLLGGGRADREGSLAVLVGPGDVTKNIDQGCLGIGEGVGERQRPSGCGEGREGRQSSTSTCEEPSASSGAAARTEAPAPSAAGIRPASGLEGRSRVRKAIGVGAYTVGSLP